MVVTIYHFVFSSFVFVNKKKKEKKKEEFSCPFVKQQRRIERKTRRIPEAQADRLQNFLSIEENPAFASHLSTIKTLTGSKYKKWRRDIELALGFMDLDMCLLEANPSVSDGDDVITKAVLDKWKRSNRFSRMFIRKTISENNFGGIPSSDNVKYFLGPFARIWSQIKLSIEQFLKYVESDL